jgi:ubiquinone/menaquinone biosynthesis C-methylase UbiE
VSDETQSVIDAWNGVLFEKFCRFRTILTQGLSEHGEELLRRHPVQPGARVLDVGCGFGDTTRRIAHLSGTGGSATGVDCAANFIASARREAEEAGPANASFFVADVQSSDLKGPYDRAFSRFGMMFFSSPGAALRNIRRSLVPGGELGFVVWRRREDNRWLYDAERCVKAIVPVVSPEETDQVHCGPGPFSMAGADMVSDLLLSSGYTRVGFERLDVDICIGRDLDEAVDFAMALGPAGEVLRLAGDEGIARQAEVREALHAALAAFARDDGVWAPSSTWLINAHNPE